MDQFVDDDTLRSAGFATRKDMKESMYRRAKVRPRQTFPFYVRVYDN